MTKVDLWNKALALIPWDRPIQAETDDSTEALRCRQEYDGARRYVLSQHEWGFATRSVPLCSGCACECVPGMYFYPRPNGVVRVIGLYGPDGRRAKADSYNGGIVSPAPGGSVRFIPDLEDLEQWPAWAIDALASELAARIAGQMTGSVGTDNHLRALAVQYMSTARQMDSSEIRWSGTDGRTFISARR